MSCLGLLVRPEIYHNGRLLMFPEYMVETQRQRRFFDGVKAALRSKGIKYSVQFLAKLRVLDGETVRFFTTPQRRCGLAGSSAAIILWFLPRVVVYFPWTVAGCCCGVGERVYVLYRLP